MSASNGGLTISGQQRDLVIQAAMINVRAMVEKAEIPMPLRRKRNGNGSVVGDNDGEQLAIEGGKQSAAAQLSKADPSRAV
jgi:hypothetical protein